MQEKYNKLWNRSNFCKILYIFLIYIEFFDAKKCDYRIAAILFFIGNFSVRFKQRGKSPNEN